MVINTATIFAIAAVLGGDRGRPSRPRPGAATHRYGEHAPIANPGDVSNSRSAQQNVAESEQYERLLRTNPAFRRARMQKECGGITDPELRQSCLASFDQH